MFLIIIIHWHVCVYFLSLCIISSRNTQFLLAGVRRNSCTLTGSTAAAAASGGKYICTHQRLLLLLLKSEYSLLDDVRHTGIRLLPLLLILLMVSRRRQSSQGCASDEANLRRDVIVCRQQRGRQRLHSNDIGLQRWQQTQHHRRGEGISGRQYRSPGDGRNVRHDRAKARRQGHNSGGLLLWRRIVAAADDAANMCRWRHTPQVRGRLLLLGRGLLFLVRPSLVLSAMMMPNNKVTFGRTRKGEE